MASQDLRIFALGASRAFGEQVVDRLDTRLSEHEERDFEDGEHKARPLTSVRGKDVYVIQSLYGDDSQSVNDKLCRLLFFLGALRQASARRITAVAPYLCYARKDQQTKPRDPVTTRYLAALFEAMGTDRIVTMDVHNVAVYQNAFRIGTEHLEATRLFATRFAGRRDDALTIVSPDAGGLKRAERLCAVLEQASGRSIPIAFMPKQRSEGVVTAGALQGPVDGRRALIVDDMISSGTTMLHAARACRQGGAEEVYVAATHGLFTGAANDVLADPAIDGVVITNTVAPCRLTQTLRETKVETLDASGMFADAIRRLHFDEPMTALLTVDDPVAHSYPPSG